MYKLLIVEDDFIIAKGLQKHFEKYHYDVQYIEDFEHVLDDFLEFQPDLVLLDIKHIDNEKCKKLTGVGNEKALKLAKHLDERNIPVWIRQVLIPGITDDQADLEKLGQFISTLNNVDRVEFLPYHGMGIHKWENMGFEYELKDVQEPTAEEVKRASDIVESFGVEVHNNKVAK